MLFLLKLTRHSTHSTEEPKKIYVQLDKICTLEELSLVDRAGKEHSVTVVDTGSARIYVTESVEQIATQINRTLHAAPAPLVRAPGGILR